MESDNETKVHLNDILAEVAKTQNIKNYQIIPSYVMNYGDGFVSQFFTGQIRNEDTEETLGVAIKKAPFLEFNYTPLFHNEYLFYNAVFPALDNLQKEANVLKPFDNVPTFFCGSMEQKKEYIAMENLKPVGYIMFDKTKCFDEEHLKLIFKTYGKFHALSFVLKNKKLSLYQSFVKSLEDTSKDLGPLVMKQIKKAVEAAVRSLDATKYNIDCDLLHDFSENMEQIFENCFHYTGESTCLLHGDCWSNNMLFKYSESGTLMDMKFLDFQVCRDASPIFDLSYFFYSGASKKEFDKVDTYLKIYHQSLLEFAKELGVNEEDLFSFDVLVNEWQEYALSGVILGIWLWQIKLTPKDEFNKIMGDMKEYPNEEAGTIWEDFIEERYSSSTFRENTASILVCF